MALETLDLHTVGSICLDGLDCLPSPWDADKNEELMMAAVFGSDGCDESLAQTAMASAAHMPADTPYYSSGNPYVQGANWPLQALKCTQTSSDTSSLQSMVVDNNTTWAPSSNSSSSAQSSDTCSEGLPGDCAAAAPPGARVVRRSRARRAQHPEVAPAVVKHERPQQKVQRRRQKQPPVKAVEQPQQRSYERPAWVGHRGPTLSGVLRPFEAVKGYGMATDSRTLQAVNARLRLQATAAWEVLELYSREFAAQATAAPTDVIADERCCT